MSAADLKGNFLERLGTFVKSKAVKWALAVFALLFVLSIVKDQLIKISVCTVGSKIIGAPLKIQRLSLRVIAQTASIKNMVIENPPGFPEEKLLDIPEITVKCDLWALLKGNVHAPLVVININELIVVKNREGRMNIDALKVIHPPQEDAGKQKQPSVKEIMAFAFQIDVMKLNVNRVIYKDFSVKGSPVIKVFEVDLKNKILKDIKSVSQLVALVIFKAMERTAIRSAGLYVASALAGAGLLPVAVAGIVMAKDDASALFDVGYNRAFTICLNLLKRIGQVSKEDKSRGLVWAKVNGSGIKVMLKEEPGHKVSVKVSARKFALPQPSVAGGILYQIAEEMEK